MQEDQAGEGVLRVAGHLLTLFLSRGLPCVEGGPVVLSGACAPRRRPWRPPSPHRGLRNARWSPVGVLKSNQLRKLETRPGVFAASVLQEQTHGLQGCPGEPGVLGGPARAWGQPGLVKWAVSTHLGSFVQLRERWPGWEWTPTVAAWSRAELGIHVLQGDLFAGPRHPHPCISSVCSARP